MKQFEVRLPNGELIEGLSGQDVIALVRNGRLTGHSPIRQQGQERWRLVKSVPQLMNHTTAVVSPGPSSTKSTPSHPPAHASVMSAMTEAETGLARPRRIAPVVVGVTVLLVVGVAVGLVALPEVLGERGRVSTGRSDQSVQRDPGVAAETGNAAKAKSGAAKGGERVSRAAANGRDPIRDAYLDSAAKHAAAARAYKEYFDAWRGDAANEARIAYEYAARCAEDAASDPGRRGLADRAGDEAAKANFVAMANAHRVSEQDHSIRAAQAGVVAGEAWQHTRRLTGRDK
jgi:hypothetical protein